MASQEQPKKQKKRELNSPFAKTWRWHPKINKAKTKKIGSKLPLY